MDHHRGFEVRDITGVINSPCIHTSGLSCGLMETVICQNRHTVNTQTNKALHLPPGYLSRPKKWAGRISPSGRCSIFCADRPTQLPGVLERGVAWLRDNVDAIQWAEHVRRIRRPPGVVRHRTFKFYELEEASEDMPQGTYAYVFFDTILDDNGSASEMV